MRRRFAVGEIDDADAVPLLDEFRHRSPASDLDVVGVAPTTITSNGSGKSFDMASVNPREKEGIGFSETLIGPGSIVQSLRLIQAAGAGRDGF